MASHYQFQRIHLQMTYPFEQSMQLSRDQDGIWKDAAGTHIASLRGCRDIDLSVSPFTNTLPIRRLDLAIGQSADITVAFIELPTLRIRPEHQRYLLLQRQGDTSIYRFEHVANKALSDNLISGEKTGGGMRQ